MSSPHLVPINGVRLHVEPAVGRGELVVLVHGGWTDHNTWGALVPHLAQSFRVVAYDRRGHSSSERGATASPRRQDEDDLSALIEQLGAPAHVVGTSYGAAIGLGLAGRRPELVASLVAHEPPLVGLVPQPEAEAGMAAVQDQIAAGDAPGATRRFFDDALGAGTWEKVPEPVQRAAIANARTFLELREDPHWASLDIVAARRHRGPILITVGALSAAWLPEVSRGVAAAVGCPLRTIAGAGHTPHHVQPAAFAAVVEDVVRAARLRRAA